MKLNFKQIFKPLKVIVIKRVYADAKAKIVHLKNGRKKMAKYF